MPSTASRRVFAVMSEASWHTFQVLTKRERRLAELGSPLVWPPNVWAGVSVESREYTPRIEALRQVTEVLRFVSFKPLLGDLGQLDLDEIDWAIVGGESGLGDPRPVSAGWRAFLPQI